MQLYREGVEEVPYQQGVDDGEGPYRQGVEDGESPYRQGVVEGPYVVKAGATTSALPLIPMH